MVATAFLGYEYSPKWFNINIFNIIFLIIVYYTIQNLLRKSNVLVYPAGNIKNAKYNKLNYKSIYFLNNLNKRRYSTIPSLNKSIETSCSPTASPSDRLNTIIKELCLNPVYVFENLDSENIRKEILHKSKGLSGIYMIVNKITKDYYIGSAATNRFYARFSNHLIYFRGAL